MERRAASCLLRDECGFQAQLAGADHGRISTQAASIDADFSGRIVLRAEMNLRKRRAT